jgi:hypothetical protein
MGQFGGGYAWGFGGFGGGVGGFGWGMPAATEAIAPPVAETAKAKPNDPIPRQWTNWPWMAGPGYYPGFDKAPPLSIPIIWQMRRYNVIRLAFAIVVEPIMASPRTIEIAEQFKDDDEAKKMQAWATQYVLPFIEMAMLPGFESLNFGFWLQEVIWDRKDGYTVPTEARSVLPGEATFFRDKYRQFSGMQMAGDFRDPRYCLLTVNNPHIDPIFGESRNTYCREEWWRLRQSEENADTTERKAAGRQMTIGIPQGMVLTDAQGNALPGQSYAAQMVNSATRGDALTYPLCYFDKDAIERNPALANIPAMKVDKIDWGNIGPAIDAHENRKKSLQADVMMAWMRPTREAMEGSTGTKAEAGTHGAIGTTDSEAVAAQQLAQINRQILNRAIITNFGAGKEGMVYAKQAPLSDPQQEFLQKVFLGLSTGQTPDPETVAQISRRDLALRVEMPVVDEEEAKQKLADAQAKEQADADAKNKALMAGKASAAPAANGDGQNGADGSTGGNGNGVNGKNPRVALSASVAERLAGYLELEDEPVSLDGYSGNGDRAIATVAKPKIDFATESARQLIAKLPVPSTMQELRDARKAVAIAAGGEPINQKVFKRWHATVANREQAQLIVKHAEDNGLSVSEAAADWFAKGHGENYRKSFMTHVLENLSPEQIRLIADEPLSYAGRELLERISGSDKPYGSEEEIEADSIDPYAEGQVDKLALAGDLSGGHWVTIDSEHVYIKGGTIESGHLAGKSIHEAHESIAKGRDREAKNSRTEAKYQRKAGNEAEAQRHEHIAVHHESKAAELRTDEAKRETKRLADGGTAKAAPAKPAEAKTKELNNHDVISHAKEIAKNGSGEYGLRVVPDDMATPNVGDKLEHSFVWKSRKDGEASRSSQRAKGVSAISLDHPRAASQIENFFGKNVVLVKGASVKNSAYQNVAGEKVISNPEVMAVWNRKDILNGPYRLAEKSTDAAPANSKPSGRAPTEDDILHEAHELKTEQHGHTGVVPTEEIRGAVAKRFGAEHAGESFDKSIHGMKASGKVRDTGAGLANFAEPATASPYQAKPGAVKEADINSAIDHVASKHTDTGLAPIHEVREHIRQKIGDEAAAHKNFDPAVMKMRGADKVRAIPVSDGSTMTAKQHQGSIPGAGETFAYLSKPQVEGEGKIDRHVKSLRSKL